MKEQIKPVGDILCHSFLAHPDDIRYVLFMRPTMHHRQNTDTIIDTNMWIELNK